MLLGSNRSQLHMAFLNITWALSEYHYLQNIYLLQKCATKWVQPGVIEKNNLGVSNVSKPNLRKVLLTFAGEVFDLDEAKTSQEIRSVWTQQENTNLFAVSIKKTYSYNKFFEEAKPQGKMWKHNIVNQRNNAWTQQKTTSICVGEK